MKTFLAFKLDDNYSSDSINESLNKVRKHYYETHPINFNLKEVKYINGNIGFIIWDDENSPLLWPNIVEDKKRVIITHTPPPNWKKFSKSKDINKAPFEIFEEIDKNVEIINNLASPTIMASIDKDENKMNIFIDAMGFGRLYEYKSENGWVWSNKIAALPLFSGEDAILDKNAWEIFATTGWFMGETSPIENVRRVSPSTFIKIDSSPNMPRIPIYTGGLDKIVSPRIKTGIDYKNIAEDIKLSIDSYSELWNKPLNVDLSGGKDSRVSAAAIISSGVKNVKFRTIGTLQEEANVAKELLSRVNRQNQHEISYPDKDKVRKYEPIIDRIKTLLHEHDGDYTPIIIKHNIRTEKHFSTINKISIQGAGGEIAKAAYYSNERWIKKLSEKGENAAFERLSSYLQVLGCVPQKSIDKVNHQIYEILEKGRNKGINGILLLDYFYFVERFRRWVPLGGKEGRYSPFLAPEFLRGAFDMLPEDKIDSKMHKEIVSYLVPEWSDIEFYKATPEQSKEKTIKKTRMWQTEDKHQIEEILNQPNLWNDVFNENEILSLWNEAKQNDIENRKETLFQRVMIRAVYNEHLNKINNIIREENN